MSVKKIILASQSPARKKLLQQIGLRFSVVHPAIDEHMPESGDCRMLVIRNAVHKARAAARKSRSGVLIAADTVVTAGGRIIGKPRNKTHARSILKALSRQPQWVYTGVAVMDIRNKKLYTACEKTKVYLSPMSNGQISHYLRKVPSLDKAGAFDIQSIGSVFVRRIEGCYTNVIGLPLARLAVLLKRAGVIIP